MIELPEKTTEMLLLIAILLATTSSHNLTCHCLNGTECHTNGYCELGCANGWFGPGCQIGNVALGKVASQSSTFEDYGYKYLAGLAVDGEMPDSIARSCSHTALLNGNNSAWWSVVLDTAHYYIITNITIVNRPSDLKGNEGRLTNFKIMYSNETEGYPCPSNSIWHECVEENGPVGRRKTYTCKNTAIAKRVAVHLTTEATKNPLTILTLCEVQIYGYQQYMCPSGYTGPGCLLRTCDQCDLNIGRCLGKYGSCTYNVCPHRSLLPPECWITLSDYSRVDIRTAATCNQLRYSFSRPHTQPNIAASSLQLQASTSDGQVLVNATIPLGDVDSTTFTSNNAAADTPYEVSVKPLYCNIPNMPCFYAASSKVFKHSTGKRKYEFLHKSCCVSVNVTSDTPDCEPPTKVQTTCQSKAIDGNTVTSSSLTVCGLENHHEYNCSITAVINNNTIERKSVYIAMGVFSSSRAPENDSHVLAGSICGSTAVIVVTVAILAIVYYRSSRRQRDAKSHALLTSQDANVKSHLPAGTLEDTKPPSSHKEQGESPYASLNMELGLQSTGDYATL